MAKADTPVWPVMASAKSMTPERIVWMRARVSDEESNNPGVAWVEWLASALDRIAGLERTVESLRNLDGYPDVRAVLRLYKDQRNWASWSCLVCGGVYPRNIITACPNCTKPEYIEEEEEDAPAPSTEDES